MCQNAVQNVHISTPFRATLNHEALGVLCVLAVQFLPFSEDQEWQQQYQNQRGAMNSGAE
jgi:hypothetical protein